MRLSIISKKDKGFTLLEIIATVVLVSIISGGMMTFIGHAYNKSITPLSRTHKIQRLEIIMENITAVYMGLLNDENVLTKLQTEISSSGYDVDIDTQRIVFDSSFSENNDNNGNILKITLSDQDDDSIKLTSLFFGRK